MRLVGVLWCACLFACRFGFCQTSFQNVQIIDVDKGLSQNSVYALYQDRQGFLWIGTADGLNRYDGKQLKVFKAPVNLNEPSNSNFIRGNITEDKSGNIWYSSENGLYKMDRRSQTIVKKISISRNQLAGSDYLLVGIHNEVVWLMSWANGFASFNIHTEEFSKHPMPFKIDISKWINQNFNDENGNIWFAMYPNDGIYRFDTKTKTVSHQFVNEDIRFIRFLQGGYYKVAQSGIHYYDSASRRVTKLKMNSFDPGEVRDLLKDGSGHTWLATYQSGLWYYDEANQKITKLNIDDLSTSFVNLTKLIIDRTKNLWVGTDGGGVFRLGLKEQPIKLLTAKMLNLNDLFVKSIVEDVHGKMWIASLNNPIVIYDPKSNSTVNESFLQEINSNPVLSLVKDNDENIWIQNEKSIFVIDSKWQVKKYQNIFHKSYPSTAIHKVKRNSKGLFAIATSSGTFFVAENKDRQIGYYRGMQGADFEETADGVVWIATRNYGLFQSRWKHDSTFEITKKFFSELDINHIHIDDADNHVLWLASDKGLIRFDRTTEQHRLFSESNGMNSSYIYGILEDSKNNLWCSTNGGIAHFDKSTERFTNYTVKDGLQNNEFNTHAFHKGTSGNLYFGGVKGLNWFRPEDVYADTIKVEAQITELMVNEESMLDPFLRDSKLELPYFRNDLSFHFSIFDYTKPDGNKVKLQLVGWDKKPQISYDLMARYNNVLPGTYSLIFSASTSNNQWSKEQKFLIIVQPPFWERWWFYAGVVMVVVSIVAFIVGLMVRQRYRLRIVELEKQNALERERRRISMEMHDDIGANLTRITLMSEAAKHKHEKEDSLNQIAETSRQVVNSMSEIIWSLNPDNKTFEQLMSYLRDQLHNLLESSGIDYQIDLPEKGDFPLSNSVKRNIILILKESVNNAVKHSGGSVIRVTGKISNQTLELEVSDNGVGFEAKGERNGNGLKNMRIRSKEVGGEICFVSENEKGTCVKIRIPLVQKQHYH